MVIYGQLGLQQMCDAAKGKWTADLLTLEHGWNGQTLVRMGRKDSDDVHLLEPAVSSLMACSKEDLSRLFETEPPSARILARMIPMAVPAGAGSAPTSHGFSLESMVDWHALIRQTNNLREAGRRDLLPLDRQAEQLLMQYWSESQSGRPQAEQKFLTQFGPVLAAKLSLGYQLAISPRQLCVSVEAMEGAIQLTKVLLRQDTFES